jgi:hypothetical protein
VFGFTNDQQFFSSSLLAYHPQIAKGIKTTGKKKYVL